MTLGELFKKRSQLKMTANIEIGVGRCEEGQRYIMVSCLIEGVFLPQRSS